MIIKGKQCLIFFFVKFSYSSNLLVDCCRLLLLHKRLPLWLYSPRGKILEIDPRRYHIYVFHV